MEKVQFVKKMIVKEHRFDSCIFRLTFPIYFLVTGNHPFAGDCIINYKIPCKSNYVVLHHLTLCLMSY